MELGGMNDPVLYAGFATECVRADSLSKFTPHSVHLLEPFVSHRSTACKERSSGCYCGTDKERQSVELKFGDFVDYFQASFTNQSHWLQTVDDLEFYLCQCPIAVYKPDAICTKATLPSIMNEFCL
ncbi:hypothetical protein BBJ29_001336 [Phytophthora kernoviae]|uniref:Uncharacterized protein n=1 Tax=Phytophthora kernoviae TaxID=325452 RepID=A0A3F2S1T7_9STRA|nr:hypothetical protein BBJ29_001336 [Phytophthora kernoviae]RLN68107.1 hypothetical protein BBP00_00001202 [Phytophthora kernoviae]